MNISVSNRYFSNVRATADYYLDKFYIDLKRNINSKKLENKNKYYIQYLKKTIDNFKKSPDKFKLNNVPKIPDGSPIGSYNCPI